ncbi:MAG TPA: GTPase HflX [Planctomycetota bacterium]|nr:GTPase HflX [Planctomycetota bacterium]
MAKAPSWRTSVAGHRVVLARLLTPRDRDLDGGEEPLAELRRLAESAGAAPAGELVQRRERPTGSHYFGVGKAAEIKALCRRERASAVIVDAELTPIQGRNLEKELGCTVLDRTELILDIFASWARTRQAKVQVELAGLEYFMPRLRRRWTHLERQTGGIGVRGGAGERQLELDQRIIRDRITDCRREIAAIGEQRRRLVAARGGFAVSLVGYTNAGKSTLMRALTGADVYIADRLFATLDTRTREMKLGGGLSALLSDTVGFIRRLPHHLVASFSATLEETRSADLILHVADLSSPACRSEMETVRAVLADLGADRTPVLPVFNKIDLVAEPSLVTRALADHPGSVAVSAKTGAGLDGLRAAVVERMFQNAEEAELILAPAGGQSEYFLRRHGLVLESALDGEVLRVRARVRPEHLGKLAELPGVSVVSRGSAGAR